MFGARQDAATALLSAVSARFVDFSGTFRLEELASRSWASLTFTGARHRLAFTLEGTGADAAANAFLGNLGEADFALRGHILADIAVVGDERAPLGDRVKLQLEALTVEDD
jgi:hypothetical protein